MVHPPRGHTLEILFMLLGLLLVAITAASCALFLLKPAWFPAAITADALGWDHQFGWTLWVAGILFIAAQLLLAWIIFRRSARPLTGSRALEWGGTAGFALIFFTLALAGSRGWARIPQRTLGMEVIEVHAHQFAWNFRYPGPDGVFGRTSIDLINDAGGDPLGLDPRDPAGKDDIVTATLRIPAGRDVLLLMHSRDVIHDFFVRELRTKQDIVPGMEIPLELHVDHPGTWEIACAELCGLGHSQMRSFLIAMPPEEYDRWKQAH